MKVRGPLTHRRYWADIDGSYHRAAALRDVFRRRVREILPMATGALAPRLKKGETLTLVLPLRGVVAMRVEDVSPERIVLATLEGHPLAGVVAFAFIERGREVRFEVEVFPRGAGAVDAAIMATVGALIQDVVWRTVVERVVELSGGRAPDGVQSQATTLEGDEAAKIEAWVEGLVVRRLRGFAPASAPRSTRPLLKDRRRAARKKKPPKPSSPVFRTSGRVG